MLEFTKLSLILWSGLLCLLVVFAFWLAKQWNVRIKVRKLPGPIGYPIVGILFEMLGNGSTDVLPHLRSVWNKFSSHGLYHMIVLDRCIVVLSRPEYIQKILSSNDQINKSSDYKHVTPWIGNGILTNTGKDWHVRRKLLTPAFHFRILEDFYHIINSHASNLIDKLATEVGKDSFPLFPHMSHTTLEVICESAMGYKMDDLGKSVPDYLEGIKIVTNLGMKRSIRPWLSNDLIYSLTSGGRTLFRYVKKMNDFTNKVIQARKIDLRSRNNIQKSNKQDEVFGQKKRLAFLDLIIEIADEGKVLSDQQIQEEVDTIMFAGHDTTAIAITWTLYALGHNPEIQDKLRQEILDVIGNDSKTQVTGQHVKNLKYMERVIKEALRLYPPVPLIARELTKDMTFDDHIVPKGVSLFMVPYLLHRMPDIFPNPEIFDPDRFLSEEVEKRHPHSYIPFSAGPRNCIGQKFAMMEMKIFLSYLVRAYSFESIESPADLKLILAAVLSAESGVLLRIKKV